MSGSCKSPERRWADLRLVGVDGMRVVDASVMPDLLGGNIDAVVMTIVEKAADMLLGKPSLSPAQIADRPMRQHRNLPRKSEQLYI